MVLGAPKRLDEIEPVLLKLSDAGHPTSRAEGILTRFLPVEKDGP